MTRRGRGRSATTKKIQDIINGGGTHSIESLHRTLLFNRRTIRTAMQTICDGKKVVRYGKGIYGLAGQSSQSIKVDARLKKRIINLLSKSGKPHSQSAISHLLKVKDSIELSATLRELKKDNTLTELRHSGSYQLKEINGLHN